MPFHFASPRRASVYSYLKVPIEENQQTPMHPQLQAMEVIMPLERKINNEAGNEPNLQIDTLPLILLIISILFIVWDVVLTVCNLSTFVYLLKHPTLFIVLVVLLFGISMVGKLATFVIAMAVVIKPPTTNTLNMILLALLITCGVCVAGFVGFCTWSWSNLSLGTNVALILDFTGYLATAVLSYVVGYFASIYAYEYVTVQRNKNYPALIDLNA